MNELIESLITKYETRKQEYNVRAYQYRVAGSIALANSCQDKEIELNMVINDLKHLINETKTK